MLFDPDGLLTREEQLEKIWAERLTPAHRAQCLAQATALLRVLKTVSPPGREWLSPDAIPEDIMQRALALLVKTPGGQVQPSDEDFEAFRKRSSEL